MRIKLYLAKISYNRILNYEEKLKKFQQYTEKTKEWKKQEMKRFNKMIYGLSSIEFEKFRKNCPSYNIKLCSRR